MEEFTKIHISFAGENQVPYLMVVKEYLDENHEVKHADIIYQEMDIESVVVVSGSTGIRPLPGDDPLNTKLQIMGPTPITPKIF